MLNLLSVVRSQSDLLHCIPVISLPLVRFMELSRRFRLPLTHNIWRSQPSTRIYERFLYTRQRRGLPTSLYDKGMSWALLVSYLARTYDIS